MYHSVAVAGADDGDVIGTLGQVGKQVGNFNATLAVLAELAGRAKQSGVLLNELIASIAKLRRTRLAMQFVQQRLGIKGFQMTGTAGHEQEDNRSCLAVRAMGSLWCQRVGGRVAVQQGGQGQAAETAEGIAEKSAPG